jgi:hypothetical protein
MAKRSLDTLRIVVEGVATSGSLLIILAFYWPYLFAVRCRRVLF